MPLPANPPPSSPHPWTNPPVEVKENEVTQTTSKNKIFMFFTRLTQQKRKKETIKICEEFFFQPLFFSQIFNPSCLVLINSQSASQKKVIKTRFADFSIAFFLFKISFKSNFWGWINFFLHFWWTKKKNEKEKKFQKFYLLDLPVDKETPESLLWMQISAAVLGVEGLKASSWSESKSMRFPTAADSVRVSVEDRNLSVSSEDEDLVVVGGLWSIIWSIFEYRMLFFSNFNHSSFLHENFLVFSSPLRYFWPNFKSIKVNC